MCLLVHNYLLCPYFALLSPFGGGSMALIIAVAHRCLYAFTKKLRMREKASRLAMRWED
jgi:hypothetical protein